MAGQKPAHQFFLTFPQCTLSKDDVFAVLCSFSSTVIVGQERHADGGIHYHGVVHTVEATFIQPVVDYVRSFLDAGGALDCQVVKGIRNVVHYVCKEDLAPLRAGDEFKKYLPFSVTAMDFVKVSPVFSLLDPFVIAHWTSYRFLEDLHREYWGSRLVPVASEGAIRNIELILESIVADAIVFDRVEWAEMVAGWCLDSFVDDRRHKQPQLYLYGPPNVGKTSLVRAMIDFDKCFFAGRDKWWMEGFLPTEHCAVIIDEFDWTTFSCKKELLKLLAGEKFVANVKGRTPMRIDVNVPVIMITNEFPPVDAAFIARVNVVYADKPCFH